MDMLDLIYGYDEKWHTQESIESGIKTKTRNCLIKHGITEDTKIRIQGQTAKGIEEILELTLSYQTPRFWIYYHIDCSNERKAKLAAKKEKEVKE